MRGLRTIALLSLTLVAARASAQVDTPSASGTSAPPQSQDKPDARPTGLPTRITWTFNLDAGWGTFGFANSLFVNPKEGVAENLSDQWFEGYVKPALSGVFKFSSTSEIYGKLSAVGERTYGSVPAMFGADVSSFGPDDLSIGWRSGTSIDRLGENGLDFVVGRAPYQLGHGMLLFDGAAEGGTRGGYWTNARKAFQFAAIGRVKPGPHLAEVFYLDRDDLPERDSGSRTWGSNYELSIGEDATLGATYLKWFANALRKPARNGMNVFNVRAYGPLVKPIPDLSIEFEYASERNGDAVQSNAWTLQAAYEIARAKWTPTFTYRYAFFQGDDPRTAQNEAFDSLFPGFYDWGSWWQGEIAGEYFLSNSNLILHMVRAHVAPNDAVGAGVILYKFSADQPATVAPGVTAKDLAGEIDAYADWKLNSNFTVSVVGGYANPGKAVEQATGRTKNFAYGMVYVAYSF